jgi:uncharacterized Zn-finger protein
MLRPVDIPDKTGSKLMAQRLVPHLVNDKGVEQIAIGVKEFECMGASPPFDHPHVYLDMGDERQMICPYCSTLYRYDDALGETESDPSSCVFVSTAPPGAPEA